MPLATLSVSALSDNSGAIPGVFGFFRFDDRVDRCDLTANSLGRIFQVASKECVAGREHVLRSSWEGLVTKTVHKSWAWAGLNKAMKMRRAKISFIEGL